MKRITGLLLFAFIISNLSVLSVFAAEQNNNGQTYSLGETVKTNHDKGYSGEKEIGENDPHYGWELGSFFAEGFTASTNDSNNNTVFLKNPDDKVKLMFTLKQDINKLNGDENLTISEDKNGYDEVLGVEMTNFKHGALIIRKTNFEGSQEEPVIYTDFLSEKCSLNSATEVENFDEGDYEVALDYEIESNPRKVFGLSIVPTYSDYRIAFNFSVRNGNCMVFPFDVKTKAELSNTSITENGFYLDMEKSRYLDINIKCETINDDTMDTLFSGFAKDGEEYTDEGIYTITVSNKYTGELTTKKIYVGDDEIAKAVVANGLTVKEIKEYIKNGATIDKNGIITLATNETVAAASGTTHAPTESTVSEKPGSFSFLYAVIPIAAAVLIAAVLIITVRIKKKIELSNPVTKNEDESEDADKNIDVDDNKKEEEKEK